MNKRDEQTAADRIGARGVWTTPRLTRMAAGDAEFGPNPLIPDGQISEGS